MVYRRLTIFSATRSFHTPLICMNVRHKGNVLFWLLIVFVNFIHSVELSEFLFTCSNFLPFA